MERLGARLRGHDETIGERMERDLEALLPLPGAPYDASDKRVSRVSSLSLVRYRSNDYSVPVAYCPASSIFAGVATISRVTEMFPDDETAEKWSAAKRWPNGGAPIRSPTF